MLAVPVPGTHVLGTEVSVDPRGWQRMRPCPSALEAFTSINGTGVSAGGRRT
jgi:hypothetical protein